MEFAKYLKKEIKKSNFCRLQSKMKNFQISLLSVVVVLINRYLLHICDANPSGESVEKILKFWNDHDNAFNLSSQNEITLFLGMTGCGKSTTALLIANADLESIQTGSGFLIVDHNEKISRNSTIISKTLIPQKIIDNNVTYYDCPGFADTRAISYDITISYLMNKLLKSAMFVKIIFVVSYSSIVNNGDRKEFIELTQQANKLIKNVTKYSDGIALVASKVDNTLIKNKKNGQYDIIPDETVVDEIHRFLLQTKVDLQTLNKDYVTEENREINEDAIKMVDIFSQRNSTYKKIGIVRKTNGSWKHQKHRRTSKRKKSD